MQSVIGGTEIRAQCNQVKVRYVHTAIRWKSDTFILQSGGREIRAQSNMVEERYVHSAIRWK